MGFKSAFKGLTAHDYSFYVSTDTSVQSPGTFMR